MDKHKNLTSFILDQHNFFHDARLADKILLVFLFGRNENPKSKHSWDIITQIFWPYYYGQFIGSKNCTPKMSCYPGMLVGSERKAKQKMI